MNSQSTSRTGSILLGMCLVALGCLAIYFTRDFGRTGLGNNNDPGSRFFPLVLASALGLWGLGSLARDIWSWLRRATVPEGNELAIGQERTVGASNELTGEQETVGQHRDAGDVSEAGGTPAHRERDKLPGEQEFIGQRGLFRMAVMACGLVGYVALIGPLGFTLSTLMFGTVVMTWLGNRWWVALLTAIAMVIVVRVLFAVMFKVQLPTGEIGLPL